MNKNSPNDYPGAVAKNATVLAVVVTAIAVTLSSCRTDVVGPGAGLSLGGNVVAPVTPGTGVGPVGPEVSIQTAVPAIIGLRAEARRDTLYVRGQLRARGHHTPVYDPDLIGGWSFQVFVDSNPLNDVYWHGFDYVVRGVEWSRPQNLFVVRQITLDPDTPGGWGPESGQAAFTQQPRGFEVAIPLASIGGIERDVEYCVETYVTVACPDCESGRRQEFGDDYFGSLRDVRKHPSNNATLALERVSVLKPSASLTPSHGHGADADLGLAVSLRPGR